MCSPTARSLFGGPDGNPSGRREQEQAPSNGIIANAADRLGIDRLTDDEIDAKDPLSLLDENIESCGTKTVDCPRQGCVTYFNVDDQTWHMVRTTCGTWSCQYCGRVKRARMLEKVQAARPNRFVTLTTIGDAKKTPREVYDWSRRQISELSKSYRRDGIEFEYLRVLEVTKKASRITTCSCAARTSTNANCPTDGATSRRHSSSISAHSAQTKKGHGT